MGEYQLVAGWRGDVLASLATFAVSCSSHQVAGRSGRDHRCRECPTVWTCDQVSVVRVCSLSEVWCVLDERQRLTSIDLYIPLCKLWPIFGPQRIFEWPTWQCQQQKIRANFLDCQWEILTLRSVLNHCVNQLKFKLWLHIIIVFAQVDLSDYNKTKLKCALCFSLLKSCGPPNDIISFFGPRLKKFSDPCIPIAYCSTSYMFVCA